MEAFLLESGADPCKFICSEAVRTLSPDGDLPSRHLCLTCLLWLFSITWEPLRCRALWEKVDLRSANHSCLLRDSQALCALSSLRGADPDACPVIFTPRQCFVVLLSTLWSPVKLCTFNRPETLALCPPSQVCSVLQVCWLSWGAAETQ